ncbi:MAG: hypothetical protein HFJ27_05750 [Clostridia bacterium]|nr:hypothetical protein [Clostridia bacterium]
MQKKWKQGICYIFIISSVLLLAGCSHSEEELLKDKLASEIKYFDSTLSNMLNKANGLTLENYKVSAKKIEDKKESEQSSGKSDGGSSENRTVLIWDKMNKVHQKVVVLQKRKKVKKLIMNIKW